MLSTFIDGVNSGVQPLLLPKTQLSWAINATVRGGYASPRPPLQIQTLNFNGDTAMEALVLTGLFQGAGVYRPDFGPSQILAQIAGRLYSFTPTGINWTVADITVPGDPNDATTSQVWMWQSEKWMIITDGSARLPIFYDGVTSRRSYGPSVVLGTIASITTAPPVAPAIGGIVELVMTAPWTNDDGTAGPFNIPVLWNGAFYQPVETIASGPSPSYQVVLQVLPSVIPFPTPPPQISPGVTVAVGNPVFVSVNKIGYQTGGDFSDLGDDTPISIILTSVQGVSVNDILQRSINTYRVVSVDAATNTLVVSLSHAPDPGPNSWGMLSYWSQAVSKGPDVIIGNVDTAFVQPAAGSNITITLTTPYTGPGSQVVWINNADYLINPPAPSAPSTTLYLVNLSDPPGTTLDISKYPDILSVPELPAGRMGAYGMGQNWMSLTDGISFIVGDIVGSASGTQAYNYRDAVLKTVELTFRGGQFRLPGSGNIINSMTFTANLDTSLGQGAIQIGTDSFVFSCQAPINFATLPQTNTPILTESLIGPGPLAQNSTILANSDTIFRSLEGFGSLILARRDFGGWGNTPISREVERALENDPDTMLQYGSAVNFNNRLLMTCYPTASGQGVFHLGLVPLNFDLISSLRGKAPAVYEGLWTGLNFLQSITGNFNSTGRAFAFGRNLVTTHIELYEILQTGDGYKDNGTTPIPVVLESAIIFNRDIKPFEELVRLENGELYLRDIVDVAHIKILYRPDWYPCWTLWRELDVCANLTATNSNPGYRTRIGLGEVDGTPCEPANNRPLRVGHFFQMRIEFTNCKFMGARFMASAEPTIDFAAPVCVQTCSEDLPLP